MERLIHRDANGECWYCGDATPADRLHRLTAYEDIGPIDHLRELAQAERDGRLVVLPCYTGDKVYIPLLGKILELEVGTIVLNGGVTTIYYYSSSLRSSPDDFGKSVFLSRTEAEAALGGAEGQRGNET